MRGLQPTMISWRLFLASTPSTSQILTNMHTAPTVDLSGTDATYVAGDAAVAIAPSATISSPGSSTLTSMTLTIRNLVDGASERLQAVTTGTSLTSSYASGVLTVSGVADVATYQTVLQSVTYSDTASSPSTTARTIAVVVKDGTGNSPAATTSMNIETGVAPSGYTITADQSTLNSTTATAASFTLANAGVGDTYSYSISSSAGGTAVTGSGTVSSSTQDVTGINVSSLPVGTLTFSVTLTNLAGDVGSAAKATATLS